MITQYDHVRRQTCADTTITDVIRQALSDNFARIPFTREGGFVSTELGEQEGLDDLTISISGFMCGTNQMFQEITVVYFDTVAQGNRFLSSVEGRLFDVTYSNGQDCFEYTTLAGDPKLPHLISTILKNHFGFKETSRLVAHTFCLVDYFKKDSENEMPKPLKS